MSYVGKYGVSAAGGASGGGSWYTTLNVSASATANNKSLVVVDMASAAGNVTITAPAPAAGENYFGVVCASIPASGRQIIVNSHSAVELKRLYCETDAIWFSYNSTLGAWLQVDGNLHDCNFTARLAPVASWSFDGDGQGDDTSGNGRNLTNAYTITAAAYGDGYKVGQLSSSFGRRWTRAGDASLYIIDAWSFEYMLCANYNYLATNVEIVSHGTGVGGVATNNYAYRVMVYNGSAGAAAQSLYQQNGVNNTVNAIAPDTYYSLTWQHWVITRGAASGGVQLVSWYLNGVLAKTANINAATGGQAANTFTLGGGATNYNMQMASIWNRAISADESLYLAKLRMGGRR